MWFVFVTCIGISKEPSETLIIRNVSRYSDDLYECVASNGVPPAAVRRIRVTVECQFARCLNCLHIGLGLGLPNPVTNLASAWCHVQVAKLQIKIRL